MALKQVTSNPTVQAVAAVLVAALGVVGVSSVRGTLGVSADPTTRHGEIAVRVDAGGADVTALAAVDPGTTGQVLTVGDAGLPVWRAAAGGSSSPTTTRGDLIRRGVSADERLAIGASGRILQSDGTDPAWAQPWARLLAGSECTAEAGSESASVDTTGAPFTITLGASSTSRTYGTSGATAARVVCDLPAGTREVDVELGITSVTGVTGGYRYTTVGLRNARDGAAPSSFWGIGHNDNSTANFYWGDMMSGGNGGNGPIGHAAPFRDVDRYLRVSLRPTVPALSVMAGSGSGARPATWVIGSTAIAALTSSNTPAIVDTVGSAAALAIVYQSFGLGGASSETLSVRIRVVTQ